MGYQDLYSWQIDDWRLLTDSLQYRIAFIHGKEFESQHNVATTFYDEIAFTKEWKVFHFQAKEMNCPIPFFPIYNCLLQYHLSPWIQPKELGKNILKDVTKSDTLAYLLNINTVLSKNALNDQYRDILIFIEELTQEISPIFLFYNFSCFDKESQILTQWMVEGKMDNYYPFLKKARYIFLCDENEEFRSYSEICKLKHIDLELREPGEGENIVEIWNKHTFQTNLTKADIHKIYLLSGGKLSNIELIIQYLSMQKEIVWKEDNFAEFIATIFEKRLSNLKYWKEAVKELLEVASEIGEKFDLRWLNHALSKSLQNQYSLLLEKSCAEQFITYNKNQGKFVTKFTWEYFHNCSDVRKKELSLMLAETVNYFSPYDYYYRAFYTEQAGDERTALDLYLFEYWKRLKENLLISKKLDKKIIKLCQKYGYNEYKNIIEHYYKNQSTGRYYETLHILEEAECINILSTRLMLLKDYLLSCIYHKVSCDKEMAERSIILMEHAAKNSEAIGEMDFRCECLNTLISLYANAGNTNKALSISKELIYYYSQRIDYDNKAAAGIQILNRKSSAYLSAEIAVKKTAESAKYFKNSILYSQYLMSLNNYGANLLVLGNFEDSLKCYKEAVTFICQHPTVKINPVYIWNNYYLASFYAEDTDRNKLLENMKHLVEHLEDTELKIIPLINLSIFYTVVQQEAGVNIALNCLYNALQLNSELEDDYYTYYINVNLAAIYFLSHDREKAIIYMEKCLKPPALMKSTEKIYLKKRSEKWLSVMNMNDNISFECFDTYLLDDLSSNTAWRFIGRGFLPSDLQFWSES